MHYIVERIFSLWLAVVTLMGIVGLFCVLVWPLEWISRKFVQRRDTLKFAALCLLFMRFQLSKERREAFEEMILAGKARLATQKFDMVNRTDYSNLQAAEAACGCPKPAEDDDEVEFVDKPCRRCTSACIDGYADSCSVCKPEQF